MKAAMAEYRKKLAEYNKVYDAYEKVAGALLARRHRQALAPAHQGCQQHPPHRRRLRADAAAGLHRPLQAGEPADAGKERRAHPRRRGVSRRGQGRVRLRAGDPGRRDRLQARLRQGRRRQRPQQGDGREDLRLRIRRQRPLRYPGGSRVQPQGEGDLHGAGLQPAPHHQHRGPAGRGRRGFHCRAEREACGCRWQSPRRHLPTRSSS